MLIQTSHEAYTYAGIASLCIYQPDCNVINKRQVLRVCAKTQSAACATPFLPQLVVIYGNLVVPYAPLVVGIFILISFGARSNDPVSRRSAINDGAGRRFPLTYFIEHPPHV